MKWAACMVCVFAALSSDASAACSGSSPTWTAGGLTPTDFSDCNTAASAGDTVNFPAGTATWTSAVTITKRLILVGAGAGVSDITLGAGVGGTALNLGVTDSSVSGFTFRSAVASDQFIRANGDGGTGRIHHNEFINTAGSNRRCIYLAGGSSIPHPVYLIDHNTFSNCRVSLAGDLASLPEYGSRYWETPGDLGGFTECVYVEDNTFTYTHQGNSTEDDYGGCIVVRFNTHSGVGETHVHGVPGNFLHTGGRQFEFYFNTYSLQSGSLEYGIWVRSGSGVIFGNAFHTSYARPLHFDIQGRAGVAGECDGSGSGNSVWDGNLGDGVTNALGWPCWNQPGTYAFNGNWNGSTYVEHLFRGIPLFLNRQGGSQAPITWNSVADEDYIRDCTELQNEDSTFDATCGTGVGVIASRPATCTTGVYYWATDEGSWNTESASDHASHDSSSHTQGADGRLYRCTATNTWTLFYTPYAYPHPLVGAAAASSQPVRLRRQG